MPSPKGPTQEQRIADLESKFEAAITSGAGRPRDDEWFCTDHRRVLKAGEKCSQGGKLHG